MTDILNSLQSSSALQQIIMLKMKNTAFILAISFLTILGCRKSLDPLPADVWSSGCVELAPFEGAYRLNGMCCEYVLLPSIKTNQNRSFKVKGSFHSFIGSGYSTIPIEISGDLSPDEERLTLRYSVNGRNDLFVLMPGKAKLMCDCFCY